MSKLKKLANILLNKLPKSKQNRFIYLDCEYVNETLGTPQRPQKHHWTELVQFGALKFDNNEGKELCKLDIMMKPSIHHNELKEDQWDFFTKLTGLTKNQVSNGTSFEKGFTSLLDFIGDDPVIIMLGDQNVIENNAKELHVTHNPLNFCKLKPILVGEDQKFKQLCSGELYKTVGLEPNDIIPENERDRSANQTHNALFDARSMAWFVYKILQNK